jgi:glycosyltransferase involved in cell wall biosynthesis
VRALHLIKVGVGVTWAERQIAELVRQGVEIHVAVPDGPMVPRYRAAGATVHVGEVGIAPRRPRQTARVLSHVRRLVDQIAPDLVHSHFVSTTLAMRLALGRRHRVPRVFQVPGPLHLENPVTRHGEIFSAGDADYWIGSCEWTCERYRRSGIDRARIFHSVYGVDIERFQAAGARSLRLEHGLSADTRLVGMVAFMYPPRRWLGQRTGLKGHEDLIDALAIVRRRLDVTGVFVGGAWAGATDYEARVVKYGRERLGSAAVFLGTRQDVPDLYEQMDVVVHPSHSENLGAASESLLLERPTIATSVGGLPDLVKDGETGWLVPPHAPQEMAEAIVDALTRRAEAARRAAAGGALCRRLMDVRRTGAEVARIYRQILERDAAKRPNP